MTQLWPFLFPSKRRSLFHQPLKGVMFSLTIPGHRPERSDLLPVSKCFVSMLGGFLPVPPRGSIHKSHGLRNIDRSITGCPVTQLKTTFKVEGMFFAPGHKLFLRIPGWSKRTVHLPLLELKASSIKNEWEEKNATYSHHVMYFLKN